MNNDIVELIRTQQDKGIEILNRDYSGLMNYIVRGILSDQNDIEECINDIHLKIWNSIDNYSPDKGKFSTWLTAISRNTAISYHRRRQVEHVELTEETVGSSSLEKDVLRREQAEELKRAVQTLSLKEQHIFHRKYYFLQQTSIIAREMGLTERSVEGLLYRIRKKLQIKLGGDFT